MSQVRSGGILLVDKPRGISSFKVVDHVRRHLVKSFPHLAPGRKGRSGGPRPPRFKCGHSGTLDPLATGLLVVLVGKGSRLSDYLMGQDKTYLATIRFGAETDTLDRDGEITLTKDSPANLAGLEGALDQFRGPIMQIPPLISALKKDGKALYKRVRAGEDVAEPDPRPVTISRLEVQAIRWGEIQDGALSHEIDLLVECSSGTYIRSLARDLGRALNSAAFIQELRRTTVGSFDLTGSMTDIMEKTGDQMAQAMLPLTQAMPGVPVLVLNANEASLVRQGVQPQAEWLNQLPFAPVVLGKSDPLFMLVDENQEMVALGRLDLETGWPAIAVVIPVTPVENGGSSCD